MGLPECAHKLGGPKQIVDWRLSKIIGLLCIDRTDSVLLHGWIPGRRNDI